MRDSTTIRRNTSGREQGSGVLRLIVSVVRHRDLVRKLALRELTDLHAGQMGGAIWVIVHPLFLFVVYSVLFTAVFRVRIGDRGPEDYLVYLFAGLGPWLLTQDVLTRTSTVMLANQSIVKKVMFPTEVLVAKSLLASLVVQFVLLTCIVVYILLARGGPSTMLLLLPLLILLHLGLLWGLALILSAWTPYFRDIPEIVRIFVAVNIYLIPVTYVPEMVPQALKVVVALNPFSHLIWCYQDVLYFERIAHPIAWVVIVALAAVALAAGSYIFLRLRHHFASVL